MRKPDHEIIRSVLRAALGDRTVECLNPRSGTIELTVETVPSVETVLREFQALRGPGWLQDAHTPQILHTFNPELACKLDQIASSNAWPVAAERVSEDRMRSLHIRRSRHGWILTRLTDAPSENGVIVTERLLSADLKCCLVYHVACRPERIGGHDELRPFAGRFCGYDPLPPEANACDSAAAKREPSAP